MQKKDERHNKRRLSEAIFMRTIDPKCYVHRSRPAQKQGAAIATAVAVVVVVVGGPES